jgi:pilus assembly protein CpaE
MLEELPVSAADKARVMVLTSDPEFEQLARSAFDGHAKAELAVVAGSIADDTHWSALANASVIVVDLDVSQPEEMLALQRLAARVGAWPQIVVVTQAFDKAVARRLLQIHVADCLVKPVQSIELVRACARAAQNTGGHDTTEAQIYTFLSATGGVGVTTLAIQTALLLLKSGDRENPPTCLIDLDFQHGACADYLDLEPRLDLGEIEPRPERLDRQLLEVMLSQHSSGLAVIAAPSRPAEMRSFDPNVVTRLLDLASAQFDYVVIDMPRTWFSWTDSVLRGSNKLFIVSEMTVPGLRHAKQLMAAIRERLGDGPHPQVIVNRFEQRIFAPGLRRTHIQQALGEALAGVIPNSYRLVLEAIDRGVPLDEVKPGNSVAAALKNLVLPRTTKAAIAGSGGVSKRRLFGSR